MSNLPLGWDERSLIELGNYVNGFAFKPEDWSEHGLPIVRIAQITGTSTTWDHYPGVLSETFRIDSGDLIFSWSGTLTVVRWSGGPAWLNQHLFRVDPALDIAPDYLFHILSASVAEMDKRAHGSTMKHIKRGELREFRVRVPNSVLEQRKIAQILDTLDTQIRQTEALIAKLERIKQGLLTDLLTRGIDQDGQLRPTPDQAPHLYKDSPLGRIPKEWDIVRLESIADMVTSGSRDWARYYSEEGAKFIRVGNLTREHINLRFDSLVHVRPPETGEGQRTRLETGDILISITADLGIVGVVDEDFGEAYINQHIALVRPRQKEVNSRFVGHFIASSVCQRLLARLNDAGAKAGLNLPTVRNILVVSPKCKEQDAIQTHLDAIDTQIRHIKGDAKKLQQQKAGLMDDLLTGRVRVTPLLEKAQQRNA